MFLKLHNTTVSHVSPTISYIPGMLWFEGTADQDVSVNNYSSRSYHATDGTQGKGSIIFNWYGRGGIWVYGGYRQRLGTYDVILDGIKTSYPGFQGGDEEDFQAVLFSSIDLAESQHEIELSNTSQDPQHSILDIDHFVFQSPYGESTRIDDRDPGCRWFPKSDQNHTVWHKDDVSHTTFDYSGGMQLNFSGIGIQLWGAVGPNNSPFSVALDGTTSRPFLPNTRTQQATNTSQLLFFQHNLPDGNHTLTIRNNPMWSNTTSAPTTLDIDYTLSFSNFVDTGPLKDTVPPKHNNLVIGAAIGGGCLLAVLLALWCCCLHRRKSKNEKFRPRPFGLIPVPQSRPTSPEMVSYSVNSASPAGNRRSGGGLLPLLLSKNVSSRFSVTRDPRIRDSSPAYTELVDEQYGHVHSRSFSYSHSRSRSVPGRRQHHSHESESGDPIRSPGEDTIMVIGDPAEGVSSITTSVPSEYPRAYSRRPRPLPTPVVTTTINTSTSPQQLPPTVVFSPTRSASTAKRRVRALPMPVPAPIRVDLPMPTQDAKEPLTGKSSRTLTPGTAGLWSQDMMPPPYRLLDMH